jgi:hypothetical protein
LGAALWSAALPSYEARSCLTVSSSRFISVQSTARKRLNVILLLLVPNGTLLTEYSAFIKGTECRLGLIKADPWRPRRAPKHANGVSQRLAAARRASAERSEWEKSAREREREKESGKGESC